MRTPWTDAVTPGPDDPDVPPLDPEPGVPPTEPIPERDPTHSPVLPEPTPVDRRHARAPGPARKGRDRPARPARPADPTYDDLYEEARRRRLPGRSAMTKVELARALGR